MSGQDVGRPIRRRKIAVTPYVAGTFTAKCDHFCGLGHFRMRGFVTVQSAADYQKWYDDQQKELKPAVATTTAP